MAALLTLFVLVFCLYGFVDACCRHSVCSISFRSGQNILSRLFFSLSLSLFFSPFGSAPSFFASRCFSFSICRPLVSDSFTYPLRISSEASTALHCPCRHYCGALSVAAMFAHFPFSPCPPSMALSHVCNSFYSIWPARV